jgi:hypothetical protein
MCIPIKIVVGSVEITISPENKFETRHILPDTITHEKLSSWWEAVKHAVNEIADEQCKLWNSYRK